MPARILSSRASRLFILLTVTALAAAGLMLVAGPQQWAHAAVSPGTTELVSTEQDAPVAGSEQATVSGDGRYVTFSTLRSLDPLDEAPAGTSEPDSSDRDVYVRDLREQRTVLLSHGVELQPTDSLGVGQLLDVLAAPADGSSANPAISADGRYVAFETTARNLGVQDVLGLGGVVGAPDTDVRSAVVVVDRDPDGDGVFDETNCSPQRYCHQVTRVSPEGIDAQGRPIAGMSAPSISAAGDAVAWQAMSLTDDNAPLRGILFPDVAPAQATDQAVPVIYRSILEKGPTGAITAVRSTRINATAEDLLVRGHRAPALSADGSRLVLVAETGPQSGTGPTTDARATVLGVDLTAAPLPDSGGEGFAALRLDVDENGSPLAMPTSFEPAPTLSGDGRLVAFTAPEVGSQVVRTVAWEVGEGPRSEIVSTDTTGRPAHGTQPALSANGRYLAFTTAARGMHNGVDGAVSTCESEPATDSDPETAPPEGAEGTEDAEGSICDVVVRDLVQDQARAAANLPRLPAELASPSLNQDCVVEPAPEISCEGDNASGRPALSGDGRVVAYESKAATLIPEDRNDQTQDVFARTFAPSLTADPLDFFIIEPGDVTAGSATLRHVGFGPLNIESMTISGANADEFRLVSPESCVEQTLHAGESCPLPVEFAPVGAEGVREAGLEVRYQGSGSPLIVPLAATADLTPPRVVTFLPEPLPFGDRLPLSTNPPTSVTVLNTGNAPLRINAVSLPPAAGPEQHPEDYSVSTDGCVGQTLRPGETCGVTLLFSPQGVGERSAVLQFDDNAPGGPHLLALQGNGIQPTLRFDPATVQAGRVTSLAGSGFAPQRTVTIDVPEIATRPFVVTADDAGNFVVSVIVSSRARPGEYRAESIIDDHQPPITASAKMRVVGRPAPPPVDR